MITSTVVGNFLQGPQALVSISEILICFEELFEWLEYYLSITGHADASEILTTMPVSFPLH